jgi:hypothetical protein
MLIDRLVLSRTWGKVFLTFMNLYQRIIQTHMKIKNIQLILSFLLLLLISLSFSVSGQEFTLKGRVTDSLTNEPLAFVNMLINDGRHGGVTDIDGRFALSGNEPFKTLRLSYVGYKPVNVQVSGKQLNIRMSRIQFELSEVVIAAGENPAHRIIINAVNNRKINNPENIPNYTFTSYDKMIFTVNADSLKEKIIARSDSSDIRLLEVIEKQHLFLMESVAEHSYISPGRSFDKVIATRVSGLKDPLFLFLISQLQSTSFYDETINILDKKYINPVSPNSVNHYFFAIRDTVFYENERDTTFVISYKPRAGKNFDGLKGLLYISSNRWAIRNVIAEPANADEKIGVRIQQMYEFIEGKHWFPVQLNTEITFNTINLSSTRPVGIGKSYRRNIDFSGKPAKQAPANISAEIMPEANNRDEAYWSAYRVDSLVMREVNTYRVLDSIGKANHFDRRMKGLNALISGRLPIGYVEIDLNRIFRYSKYEGTYLGLGLSSSDKLSSIVKIGGYWGYGFGDKQAKYGSRLSLKLHRYGNIKLAFGHSFDLTESAGTTFFDDQNTGFNALNYRNFYVRLMDKTFRTDAMLTFRMLRYISAGIGIASEYKQSGDDYAFRMSNENLAVLSDNHRYGKVTAGMKFAWGERFIRDQFNQVSTGTRYPELWLQYTRGQKGLFDGQFDFNRIDFKLKATADFRFVGKTTVWLTGSLVDGEVPMSELINGRGGGGSGFSLFAPFSFMTMRPDEFLNDRFAAAFITHSFGKLLFRTKNFEPVPSLVFNAGIGSLQNRLNHQYSQLKTMEKGYFETGLLIDNLISSSISAIGVGVFYRAGAYSNDNNGRNLFFRLSINYAL